MKKAIFMLAITILSYSSFAQMGSANIEGFKVSGGINLAIPASHLKSTSIGAGLDLLGQYGVSGNLGITVDAGYTALFQKNGGDDLGIIPIRAGLRYYTSPTFYVAGKVGIGILTSNGNSSSTTAYSFGGGYKMSPKVDLGLTYDGYSKNGSIGLVNIRLGYFFGN